MWTHRHFRTRLEYMYIHYYNTLYDVRLVSSVVDGIQCRSHWIFILIFNIRIYIFGMWCFCFFSAYFPVYNVSGDDGAIHTLWQRWVVVATHTYASVGDQRLLGGYGVAWSSGMRSTSYRIKIGESSKMQSEYVWKYISTGISECRIWEMHLWILPINRKRNYQILTYLTYAYSHTYNNTPLTIPHSRNKVNFMIMSISTERNKS